MHCQTFFLFIALGLLIGSTGGSVQEESTVHHRERRAYEPKRCGPVLLQWMQELCSEEACAARSKRSIVGRHKRGNSNIASANCCYKTCTKEWMQSHCC